MKMLYLLRSIFFSFLTFTVLMHTVNASIETYSFETVQQEKDYNVLIDEIRCLVCQNQNLADYNAELAKDLRRQVHKMLVTEKIDKDDLAEQADAEQPVVDQASKDDIIELNNFYEEFSGGLMMHSLDLTINDDLSQLDVSEEYGKIDIRRERAVFSLKRKGALKAIIVVSLSESGLNMSDVTNCINFIVLDRKDFSKDVLNYTLKNLSGKFSQQTLPMRDE